jgi:DNA polymerase kappa
MSQFYDEKDNPSTSTQKTLDIFFRSSHNNSNSNGTRDDCLEHDAGTDGSMDQQAFLSHDESLFISEQRSSVNCSSDDALGNRLIICKGIGGTKLDDVEFSEKVCLS